MYSVSAARDGDYKFYIYRMGAAYELGANRKLPRIGVNDYLNRFDLLLRLIYAAKPNNFFVSLKRYYRRPVIDHKPPIAEKANAEQGQLPVALDHLHSAILAEPA